jgi:hypothetical protein
VRQTAGDGERIPLGRNDNAGFENTAQAFNVLGGPSGEVADRALTDLAILAVTLAQQNGGRRVPIWNSFDIHGSALAQHRREYKSQFPDYMATFGTGLMPLSLLFLPLHTLRKKEVRFKGRL